jgi:AmiR/NasT family two-component response regulator
VVEQAKGILAERLRLDMEGAFELLRYAARSEQTKLQEVAAEVVGSEETPPSVVRALTRHAALLAQSPPG